MAAMPGRTAALTTNVDCLLRAEHVDVIVVRARGGYRANATEALHLHDLG